MLIPKNMFAVSGCASDDETRQNLCAVHITRRGDKVVAESTDGHCAIVASVPETDSNQYPQTEGFNPEKVEKFEALIPVSDWVSIGRALPKRSSLPVVLNAALSESNVNGRAPFCINDLDSVKRFEPRTVTADFVKLSEVIPKRSSSERAFSFNAHLMNQVLASISGVIGANCDSASRHSAGHGACQVIMYVPADPCHPCRIEARNSEGVETIAVLMPMRLDPSDTVSAESQKADEPKSEKPKRGRKPIRDRVDGDIENETKAENPPVEVAPPAPIVEPEPIVQAEKEPEPVPVVVAAPEVIKSFGMEGLQDSVLVKAASGVVVRKNDEKAGIEIVFPAKPSDAVRESLKAAGFRWSRFASLWYRKDDGRMEEYRARFAA